VTIVPDNKTKININFKNKRLAIWLKLVYNGFKKSGNEGTARLARQTLHLPTICVMLGKILIDFYPTTWYNGCDAICLGVILVSA
jgi:hypothetical protein